METHRRLYVIAYDVVDDRRRTKLAELLLTHGDRVQKSVFECELSPEELQEVLRRAAKWVADSDSLLAYPLCRACAGGIQVVGRETPAPPEGWLIV